MRDEDHKMPLRCGYWFFWPALLCLLVTVLPASGVEPVPCNPLVKLVVKDASLTETLSRLSTEHDFEVVFPGDVDRPVSLDEELLLHKLLEDLTGQLNTSFIFRDVAGCVGNKLVKLIIYPVGEQAEAKSRPVEATPGFEYIYIDDMDRYAEEVFLRKRKSELMRMTPEQREQFRVTMRRVRKTLEPKLKSGELKRESLKMRKAGSAAAGG